MRFAAAFPLLILAVAVAPAAQAAPVTVRAGESWIFTLERGEPVRAHRVPSSAKPGPGEIKATVVAGMGTTMTLTNHSPVAYSFRAELIGPKALVPRTCTLHPNRQPTLEYWPVKAAAVRLSGFKLASKDGSCP